MLFSINKYLLDGAPSDGGWSGHPTFTNNLRSFIQIS